jgi:aminoglycoside phosphotransferase (APT) family kinase protein
MVPVSLAARPRSPRAAVWRTEPAHPSAEAALPLAREICVLTALAREPKVPFLPEVVASSADPLLMITRRVPGTSLFEVADLIDPDHAASQLVRFLAALHHPAARQRAEAAIGTLTGAQLPPASGRCGMSASAT